MPSPTGRGYALLGLAAGTYIAGRLIALGNYICLASLFGGRCGVLAVNRRPRDVSLSTRALIQSVLWLAIGLS
jgi:hypothetical protein